MARDSLCGALFHPARRRCSDIDDNPQVICVSLMQIKAAGAEIPKLMMHLAIDGA
jgi:hypothetical protein